MGFSNISKPKRSLGQNFFVNVNLGRNLVEKTLETNPEKVIEIGPGRGFFTKLFVEMGVQVIAIEKDNVLSENLKFLFPEIEIFDYDIFSENIKPLFQKTENTVCFGSLPYNISKKIISYVAQNSNLENFYFIIQKEVAGKYTSQKKHSVLSLATNLYFDSKIVCNIAPENFKPKPNVVSSFVKFSRNDNLKLVKDPEDFLKYLHRAFKQPRKKLKNNLEKHYSFPSDMSELLHKRAEDFDLNNHLNIWEKSKPKVV
jgi:16S rRNA (adenine1518-N6/adenine1519-N6)-dimethyltransferase